MAGSDSTLGATVTPSAQSSAELEVNSLPVASPHRYLVERELGQGGQSVVFCVRDAALGREVALKTARHSGDAAAAFVREARITGQLEHPGIVPVHELGRTEQGEYYCTQKLVRGRTFRDALSAATTLEERLALLSHFIDLCNAVAYAHSRGVVHRDLKPENVMVGEFGETVVLDWGVARLLATPEEPTGAAPRSLEGVGTSSTQAGSVVGTPLYMSPEQARGDIAAVDARSDVWSLGVMLYELTSGHRPFEGRDARTVLSEIGRGQAKPLREVEPDAPPELAAVIERALRMNPAERFADARELAAQVSAFQSGARVGVYRYSSLELLRRFISRNRALALVSLLALGSLTVSEVLAWRWLGQSEAHLLEARENLASLFAERARGAQRASDWTGAFEAWLGAEQSQPHPRWRWAAATLQAWATPARVRPGETAYTSGASGVLDLDGDRALISFPGRLAEAVDSSGRFSHVPRATIAQRTPPLALARGGGRWAIGAAKVTVGGPEVAALELEGTSGAGALAFSSDASLLAVAEPGAVRLYELAAGKLQRELTDGVAHPSAVAISPNARWVAEAGHDGTLRWWTADGSVARTAPSTRGIESLAFSADERWLFAGDSEHLVQVLDLEQGSRARTLSGHQGTVSALAVSPDGLLLASASADRTVALWHLPTWRLLARLSGETREWVAVSFSADGSRVGALDASGRRLEWNVTRLRAALPIAELKENGHALALGEEGSLWIRTERSLVRLDQRRQVVFTQPLPSFGAILPVPEGALAAVVGALQLHSDKDGSTVRVASPCQATIASLLKSPDGKKLWAACGTQVLELEAGSLAVQGKPLSAQATVRHLALSPDGTKLAWAATDGSGQLWAVDERRKLGEWSGGARDAVAFSPEGDWLLTAGASGVLMRDASSGREVRALANEDLRVRQLGFAFGEAALWVVSTDSLSLWDFSTGKRATELPGLHRESLAGLATPDGRGLWVSDSVGQVFEYHLGDPAELPRKQ